MQSEPVGHGSVAGTLSDAIPLAADYDVNGKPPLPR